MAIYLSKAEVENMRKNIYDKNTGMTQLDYFEWSHPYEDIIVLD